MACGGGTSSNIEAYGTTIAAAYRENDYKTCLSLIERLLHGKARRAATKPYINRLLELREELEAKEA